MNQMGRKKFLYVLFFLGCCYNALEATDTAEFKNNQHTPKQEDSGTHTPKQTVGPNMWNTTDPELLKLSKRRPEQQLTQDPKRQKTTK